MIAKKALKALQGDEGASMYMGDLSAMCFPSVTNIEAWFTVRLVLACRREGGVWQKRGDKDLEKMCMDAVGLMRVLDKQFERFRIRGGYGADLPKEMVKAAHNLELDLDIGVDIDNKPRNRADKRRRLKQRRASKSNLPANPSTIIPTVQLPVRLSF